MPFVPSTFEFGQGVLPKVRRTFEHRPVRLDVDFHKGYVRLPSDCRQTQVRVMIKIRELRRPCGMEFSVYIKLRKLTLLQPYQNRRFCALTTECVPFVHQRQGSGVNLFYPLPDRATPLCLHFSGPLFGGLFHWDNIWYNRTKRREVTDEKIPD